MDGARRRGARAEQLLDQQGARARNEGPARRYVCPPCPTFASTTARLPSQFAHTLYLEAPACVGYSYADTTAGCHHDDASQAVDNLAALVAFYKAYPEFATNPFWITGE